MRPLLGDDTQSNAFQPVGDVRSLSRRLSLIPTILHKWLGCYAFIGFRKPEKELDIATQPASPQMLTLSNCTFKPLVFDAQGRGRRSPPVSIRSARQARESRAHPRASCWRRCGSRARSRGLTIEVLRWLLRKHARAIMLRVVALN